MKIFISFIGLFLFWLGFGYLTNTYFGEYWFKVYIVTTACLSWIIADLLNNKIK